MNHLARRAREELHAARSLGRHGARAVAGEGGFPGVEGDPVHRLQPGRHALSHRVSSDTGTVPPGVVAVEVTDDDGGVVTGKEAGVEPILPVVSRRPDGRSVDVEDIQVLRS